MENYYFLEGDHRRGPFSLDQLKTYPITVDTPIWKDSRNEWMPAEELEELRAFVTAEVVSPVRRLGLKAARRTVRLVAPGPAQSKAQLDRRTRRVMWAVLAMVVVVSAGFYSIINKRPAQSAVPYISQERTNPINYLEATGNYHADPRGTKWMISGIVANNASHTNYRDVVVKVEYYNKINTVIYSRDYIVNGYFLYGMKKAFRLLVDKPAVATSCAWTVTGATVQ